MTMENNYQNIALTNKISYLINFYGFIMLPITFLDNEDLKLLKSLFLIKTFKYKKITYIRIEEKSDDKNNS